MDVNRKKETLARPASFGRALLALAWAFLATSGAEAQISLRPRVTPTPAPSAAEPTPLPRVRKAIRLTPTPTDNLTEDGIPVRPAERVMPKPGQDSFTPDDPLRRNLDGSPAAPARRGPAIPTAPEIKRPAEPAMTPEDGTTIRISPATGEASTAPDVLQVELANNFYARKEWAAAAAEYEKYLGNFPSGADRQAVFYRLGECYRVLNRVPAATTSYRNLLIEGRESGEFIGPANYRLAVIYYTDKDYRSALPLFQRSSQLAKANDVRLASLYYSALCLEHLERRVETREVFERIAEIGGENPYRDYARVSLARQAYSDGRRNEALRQFEALARDASKESLKAEATLKAGLLAAELNLPEAGARALQAVVDWPGTEITPAQRSDARLGLLRMLYRGGKYREVVASFDTHQAQLAGENRAEAMLLAANSHRQTAQPQEALALYSAILKEFPRSPQAGDVAYQRIVTLYASNDAGLEKSADAYLLTNPEQDKADKVRLIKAEILFKKDKWPEAAGAYAAVVESAYIEPKYRAEAAYRMGHCYVQLKLPDKVIEAFSRFLRAYPESTLAPKALAQRGLAYQQFRNFPAALLDFNALLADFPKAREREIALRQKALLLGQTEDSKGMLDTFRMLLHDFPNTSSAGIANYWIGRTAFEAKNYKDAVPALTAARADPEYKNRAWLLLILSHFNAEAKEPLETEVSAYLKSGSQPAVPAQVLNYLGSFLLEARKYDRAEPYLAAAAASPSNANPDVWLVVARCRLFLKDFAGARTAADKYLETKPTLAAAKTQGLLARGEALVGLGDTGEAQKAADEALKLQAEGRLNAEGRLLMGQIALAKGDALEAAKAFASVAVLYDDPELTPRALSLAIEAYRKAGREAEAKKLQDELSTRFPSFAAQGR